jgi:hypothetical protein
VNARVVAAGVAVVAVAVVGGCSSSGAGTGTAGTGGNAASSGVPVGGVTPTGARVSGQERASSAPSVAQTLPPVRDLSGRSCADLLTPAEVATVLSSASSNGPEANDSGSGDHCEYHGTSGADSDGILDLSRDPMTRDAYDQYAAVIKAGADPGMGDARLIRDHIAVAGLGYGAFMQHENAGSLITRVSWYAGGCELSVHVVAREGQVPDDATMIALAKRIEARAEAL